MLKVRVALSLKSLPPGGPRQRRDPVGRGHNNNDAAPHPRDVETRRGPGADPSLRSDPVSLALREPHRLMEPLVT